MIKYFCDICGKEMLKDEKRAYKIAIDEIANKPKLFGEARSRLLIGCPISVIDYRGCDAAPGCKAYACWLDWLKQEVKE